MGIGAIGAISGVGRAVYMPILNVSNNNKVLDNQLEQFNAGKVEETGSVSRTGKAECQTCKSRTYVDRSDDIGVSFKTPGHISPEASAAVVASHEGEHVAAAVAEGAKPGNQLVSSSVRLHTDVCPECGKTYVSGGVTSTTISYSEPSQKQGLGKAESEDIKGMFIDKLV